MDNQNQDPGQHLSLLPSCRWPPAASWQAEDVMPGLLSLWPHGAPPRQRLVFSLSSSVLGWKSEYPYGPGISCKSDQARG